MITAVGYWNEKISVIEFALKEPDSLENVTKRFLHSIRYHDPVISLDCIGNDGIYKRYAHMNSTRSFNVPIFGMKMELEPIEAYAISCYYSDPNLEQRFVIIQQKASNNRMKNLALHLRNERMKF